LARRVVLSEGKAAKWKGAYAEADEDQVKICEFYVVKEKYSIAMKNNKILNFILGFLLIHLFPLTSNTQPDYLSREFDFCNSFSNVISFDSGYILRNGYSTLYKTDFIGDTIKSLIFQGRLPGLYSFSDLKSQDENIILSGTYKDANTGQSMLFISKLNFNLDTLWVRYYPGLASGYITQFNDTIAVININSSCANF
jgi:hypothetical protein